MNDNKLLKVMLVIMMVGVMTHIAWDKEAVKAFITGGVFVWMVTRFCKV